MSLWFLMLKTTYNYDRMRFISSHYRTLAQVPLVLISCSRWSLRTTKTYIQTSTIPLATVYKSSSRGGGGGTNSLTAPVLLLTTVPHRSCLYLGHTYSAQAPPFTSSRPYLLLLLSVCGLPPANKKNFAEKSEAKKIIWGAWREFKIGQKNFEISTDSLPLLLPDLFFQRFFPCLPHVA